MANNIFRGGQLPADAFNPQPNQATLATTLVTVGIYVSSSVISSMLRPAVVISDIRIHFAFGAVALAMIFLFGVGMIGIGWLVADYPTRYTALGRTVTRTSHVVLVFAVALHDVTSTSTNHTDI